MPQSEFQQLVKAMQEQTKAIQEQTKFLKSIDNSLDKIEKQNHTPVIKRNPYFERTTNDNPLPGFEHRPSDDQSGPYGVGAPPYE